MFIVNTAFNDQCSIGRLNKKKKKRKNEPTLATGSEFTFVNNNKNGEVYQG
jgi:hypothetical protein